MSLKFRSLLMIMLISFPSFSLTKNWQGPQTPVFIEIHSFPAPATSAGTGFAFLTEEKTQAMKILPFKIICLSVASAFAVLTFACHDPHKDQNSNDAYDQNGKNYGSSNLENDPNSDNSMHNNGTQQKRGDSTNYNNSTTGNSTNVSTTGGTTSGTGTSTGTTGSTTSGGTTSSTTGGTTR